MQIPSLDFVAIPFEIFGVAFLLVFILTVLFSASLLYHWKNYSLNAPIASMLTVAYSIVTSALLGLSALLLMLMYFIE
jgi:hypothetical protein